MYYLKIVVVGLSLLSFTGQQKAGSLPGKDLPGASGNQIGLYLSAGDFKAGKLSYAGDCGTGGCTIKLHELFGSTRVDLVCNGQKQVFSKEKVYGYRDCDQSIFRFSGQRAYRVLDTTGFYLYSLNKLVQGAKIARPQPVYYFSTGSNDPVQELTLANLQQAFAGDAKFRYQLEAQFRSDKDLIAYDDIGKTYKIKQVYRQSAGK